MDIFNLSIDWEEYAETKAENNGREIEDDILVSFICQSIINN